MSKILRVWAMSLNDFSHVRLECPQPLTVGEIEDVMALLEIAKRQIQRFDKEVVPDVPIVEKTMEI